MDLDFSHAGLKISPRPRFHPSRPEIHSQPSKWVKVGQNRPRRLRSRAETDLEAEKPQNQHPKVLKHDIRAQNVNHKGGIARQKCFQNFDLTSTTWIFTPPPSNPSRGKYQISTRWVGSRKNRVALDLYNILTSIIVHGPDPPSDGWIGRGKSAEDSSGRI